MIRGYVVRAVSMSTSRSSITVFVVSVQSMSSVLLVGSALIATWLFISCEGSRAQGGRLSLRGRAGLLVEKA